MNPYQVKVNINAISEHEALEKARILSKIGNAVSLDNLKFLGEISQKPSINKTLSKPMNRLGIKAKL